MCKTHAPRPHTSTPAAAGALQSPAPYTSGPMPSPRGRARARRASATETGIDERWADRVPVLASLGTNFRMAISEHSRHQIMHYRFTNVISNWHRQRASRCMVV
ncbi:hypothetical protein EVAR_9007_1 [Eumeta japonica]|uniref:Uncharacterized protein n=1 Tax=Eumeta variegata TaxID=151549 RepID=A0A4C1WQU6_EUMVA|nr:hypothetical protein EVAR_9007_1 [Eumeta japonica]